MQNIQKEDNWAPRPEMTPRKVERGHQPERDQDSSSRPPSQKRWSQSRPQDEASARKGRTDSDNCSGKIQVRIDWANTGIGKPVPKPDSKHPSFKADPSGVDEPQPRMKSTVTKPKQPSETQEKDSGKKKEDAEKKVLQDKPHRWIEARVKHLDLGGYPDEVKSLRYFGRNARDFAMGIVAIADWGWRYLDHPTIPIHSFTRGTPIGGTGTSENISVWSPRRGCSPTLPRVLEVASDSAAVLDGRSNCRRWCCVQRACPSSKCPSTVCDGHSKSGFGTRIQGILGGRNHPDAMADQKVTRHDHRTRANCPTPGLANAR